MALQTRRELLTRVAPRDELVNVPEFEAEAERVLTADVYRLLAGGDRASFERITFRPRMMVNCVDLTLSVDLFGVPLFAPIVVGPVADQRRFHPDGELATVRGAAAAKAAVVVSSRSSHPIEAIAAAAETPLLFQVFASDGAAKVMAQARTAQGAGCKAIVVTIDTPGTKARSSTEPDWGTIDAVRGAVSIPVIAKGVMYFDDRGKAASHGAQGLVVSQYGRIPGPSQPAPLEMLPAIAARGVSTWPVLYDGGVRRGSDVMKALALGARAVFVARPVMWGLAAYGADGVQSVLELLQTDLARVMGCCGTPSLGAITERVVHLHAALPPPAV